MMQRDSASHKGENGKAAVIGGSAHMHGAPLLSALAAEASGADLVFVFLPQSHAEVAKNTSLNFQVHPFGGNELTPADAEAVLELLATLDVAVLGPGIAGTADSLQALRDIIAAASCPLVLDATALQSTTPDDVQEKPAVLTPHLGELERMGLTPDALPSFTADHPNLTVVRKGETDHVYNGGEVRDVRGGNAGLTVGGTGDVLAGLIGGLLAQGVAHDEAGVMACSVIKRAAEGLYPNAGYAFTAEDVLAQIPALLHTHTA